MIHSSLIFCWGIVLLFSWIGWGWLTDRLICSISGERRERLAPWGAAAVLGMAAFIAIGGVLNLLHLATAIVLRCLTGSALAAFLIFGWTRQGESAFPAATRRDFGRAVWIICGGLVLFVYAANVRVAWAPANDDTTGYFALTKVMQQTGTINRQPFSERRMLALGGDTLLRATAELDGSFESARMIDPGLALIVIAGLVTAAARRVGAPPLLAAVIPAYLACAPVPIINATSVLLLVATLFACAECLQVAILKADHAFADWARAGLIAASAVSLKSSAAASVSLLGGCAFLFAIYRSRGRRERLIAPLAGAGVALIALLPWMISSRVSSGTLMFPLLGRGVHHGVYSSFSWSHIHWNVLKKSVDSYLRWTVALLIVWAALRGWKKGAASVAAALMAVSAIAASFLLDLRLDGFMIARFQFPILMAAIITMSLTLGSRLWSGRIRLALIAIVIAGALFTEALVQYRDPGQVLKRDWIDVLAAVHRPTEASEPSAEIPENEGIVFPPGVAAAYRSAQNAIPTGAPVLLVAAHAFLWDFQRNPGLIADNVGSASPPPGMPLDDANAMASYLRSQGIRYVFVTGVYTKFIQLFVNEHPEAAYPVDREYLGRVVYFQTAARVLARQHAIFDRQGFLILDLESRQFKSISDRSK